jgi:D-glycero-alpha-D-manno-heptose-7-phosphate kinase
MIIVRSPLRITLGGGGTDLPSYYRDHGGFLVAAAIDKYVYITLHKTFQPGYIVKYSELERVERAGDIRHPIVRAAIELVGAADSVEIASMADIPAGTGLGSSGSFTTALLRALHTRQRNVISPHTLANQACHIEIELLREPVGKQDQFIAAYGGVTCFEFNSDDSVTVNPAPLSSEVVDSLEDGLCLFFTGYTRSASNILKDQHEKSKAKNVSIIDNLHYVKDLGRRSLAALTHGDLPRFAELMDEQWRYKKKRSGDMSNPKIDEWYNIALRNGALGGKLIGAGGGGFLMFYTENRRQLLHAMLKQGLEEVRFRFDFEGSKTMIQ